MLRLRALFALTLLGLSLTAVACDDHPQTQDPDDLCAPQVPGYPCGAPGPDPAPRPPVHH